MDSDFSAKLQGLLSDPNALAKITAIASTLGAGNAPSQGEPAQSAQSAPSAQANPPLQSPQPLLPADPRLALLSSVKPLLRQEKQGKIDSLLSALAVASMLKSFKK
ncbi:MAG: hypothetical protein IKZ23_01925 [Clostridia bacterium]|nr:hypothetical protein [Clostridia bacterium]